MAFKVKDHFFHKAKSENFLARSIYKLEEIDQKHQVLRPGQKILDLGYYPGSWIQYTQKKIAPNGIVVGVDIKPINEDLLALKNVSLYQDDFLENQGEGTWGDQIYDVVLSDMAPNTTGIKSVDQARSLELVELVMSKLPRLLRHQGSTIIKVFDSSDAQKFLRECKKNFGEIKMIKPKSVRSVSKEFFFFGKAFKGS